MNKVATASFAAGFSSLMLPCELSILKPEASRLRSIDLQVPLHRPFSTRLGKGLTVQMQALQIMAIASL